MGKDYTIWKVSTLISQRLVFVHTEHDIVTLCSVLILLFSYFINKFVQNRLSHTLHCESINSITILVFTDNTFYFFTQAIKNIPNKIMWIFLLSILNIVHVIL